MLILALTALGSISIAVALALALVQRPSLPQIPPSPLTSLNARQGELGLYDGRDNSGHNSNGSFILDRAGDARPDPQYKADIVPETRGYHDILWASVRRMVVVDGGGNNNNSNGGDSPAFLLTIKLAGDPNLNEKYETSYVWHIMTPSHAYTVLLPNFAQDSNFTAKGWYFAVYDNTASRYVVPMTRIFDMPKGEGAVEFPLDASYIGNPSSFYYWVSVHVRVDTRNLDKPPDYMMDYAP
jgi:hypothetical protein